MVTSALNMLITMVYTVLCAKKTERIRCCVISRRILKFTEVKEYLKISFPSMTMLCAEWWAYELMCFIASMISTEALGAQTIAYNFYTLVFMFPFGFAIGATSCVGNAIGERKAHLAKMFSWLAILYSTLTNIVLALLVNYFSKEIALTYTKDETIVPILEDGLKAM